MELRFGTIGGSRAQFLEAVDRLVRRGGEDKQLVPLMGEEPRVNLHGKLLVEGKALGPLH